MCICILSRFSPYVVGPLSYFFPDVLMIVEKNVYNTSLHSSYDHSFLMFLFCIDVVKILISQD